MLFSAWQAMVQALQPMQLLRSTLMPQLYSPGGRSGYRLGGVASSCANAGSTRKCANVPARTGARPSIA